MSYRYRLYDEDGNDIGETRLAVLITPGEEIIRGPNEPNWRVLDVVAVMETDSPFVAFLKVASAEA